ncbi:MAG TPA: MBL fold metallo-hydrolase [Clostridiaceae bacterium]|jgi:hypothetical protein|nr:MBL fold metallo-hydrolase [Clostridiaceae bacterium]
MYVFRKYIVLFLSICFVVLFLSYIELNNAETEPSPGMTIEPTILPTPKPTEDNDTTLPEYIGGSLSGPFESSGDTVVYKVDNTTKEQYENYVEKIMQKRFENVLSNDVNGNLYNTFVKKDRLVHISYFKQSTSVIIVYETRGFLPKSVQKLNSKRKYQPLLTQIKLDSNDMLEGMSYVFRLSDGSFFIIDGGWPEKEHSEAKKLYNLLREQTSEEEIVIQGWLLTHCHSDHIGTFNDFVIQYHDKVTIKQVLYNFPSDDDILNSDSPHMLDDHLGRYKTFKKVIGTYLYETDIVKIHSGYKFNYVDAEIEILQTHEDFYPITIRDSGMNLSSVLFTVTIAEQRIIFLADANEMANDRLVLNFGQYLKSDMMQVAHHGYSGGTVELYKIIDAEYMLYPAPVEFYKGNLRHDHNRYFLFESKTVKQVFTMGFHQFTLPLPYTAPEGAKRIPYNLFKH